MIEAQKEFDASQARLADTTAIYREDPSLQTRINLHAAQGNFILAEIAFFKAWSGAGKDDDGGVDLVRLR